MLNRNVVAYSYVITWHIVDLCTSSCLEGTVIVNASRPT